MNKPKNKGFIGLFVVLIVAIIILYSVTSAAERNQLFVQVKGLVERSLSILRTVVTEYKNATSTATTTIP